ncbi:phosphoglycerate mutase, partial [Candidatus Desantisbacteria bacterium]|nr:phosphoglycerate mutase [Candidatus Desantisbacteria bacterium]
FLHVEAPDESGHEGSIKNKIKAIEDFDKKIVGPIIDGIKKFPEYRILLLPDHPTPIKLKTHTSDPVPFAIMGTGIKAGNFKRFTESEAVTSPYKLEGKNLITFLIGRKI